MATGYDPLRDTEPELARTMAASVTQRIAFGECAGQKVRRIGSGFGSERGTRGTRQPLQQQDQEDEALLPGQGATHEAPTHGQANGEATANRTGLPAHLQEGIEHLAGLVLDDVKVPYHSSKPAPLHALAYTRGTDIYVGPGQEQHLPHEAWHVV